jgi:predicted kinase
MTSLIVTVGLPGSGKTRAARYIQEIDTQTWVLVSRDDIRESRFGAHGILDGLEDMVTQFEEQDVISALKAGFSVIVHDTNLRMRYRRRWQQIADEYGATYEQMDFTGVPLETCLKRNQERDRQVPEAEIQKLHRKFIKPLKGQPMPYPESVAEATSGVVPYSGTPGAPKAILVDVDGTVAKMNGRSPFDYSRVSEDLPNQPIIDLVRAAHYDLGYKTVFLSGRPGSCRDDTEEWLYEHVKVPIELLVMRLTGDGRTDYVVKQELFDQHIRNYYDVRWVLDDRNQVVKMWRSMGLTCLQVDEGDF